jgi:hypothetical protein
MGARLDSKMSRRALAWLPIQPLPRLAKELYAEAEKIGISNGALAAAMRKLGILVVKTKAGWMWVSRG